MVEEAVPVAEGARRMLDAVEALAIDALLLQRPDPALDHAFPLGAIWHDELLSHSIVADQGGVSPAGKNQPVGGPRNELARHLTQTVTDASPEARGYGSRSRGPA